MNSTGPSALRLEVMLMILRIKKRNPPDKVPTGLLGSGQDAANVTLQVYPDIWRQGTSSAIWEGQRMFQSQRGTGRRHEWQDHFSVEQCQPGRAGNKFKGENRVQTDGGTRGDVTSLWIVGEKAGEHWLSAEAASLGRLVQ